MRRRVVVTGMGIISPLGIGVEENWSAIINGKSGIGPITRFDTASFPVRFAGEVAGFNAERYMGHKEVKKMDRFIHFAVAASDYALKDSGYKITEKNAERVGVQVGVGLGGLPAIEKYHNLYKERGVRRISPFFIPMVIANLASGQVSIHSGAKGPNTCVVTACATGTHSIGDAARLIQYGDADVMIAGGTESVITPLCVGGFHAAKALSTRNGDPEGASRPVDKDRDGFVYGEIIGYALNGDAYHITSTSPNGEGAARCMKLALKNAGINNNEVQYINAHGTSTGADSTESQSIKSTFGHHAYDLSISSTKSMTGHLLGAAGGVEAIYTLLAISRGILPPTINYNTPDPECDLDYIPNQAREVKITTAISNSFGFGGTNAVLVFKRLIN